MICYDHVSIRVTDLDRAISFYRDLVGLDLVSLSGSGTQTVFRAGEGLLVLFCRADYRSVNPVWKTGTDHIAFCLDGETYGQVLARLRDADRVSRGPTVNKGAHGDGLATYFYDPDGNELEIEKYEGVTSE